MGLRLMGLVESSGTAAVSFLQRDPIGNVYPIYAALRSHGRPVGLLAIGPNDETRGVLVDAALCASETVRDIYIVSSDNDVVRELFQAAQPRIVKNVKQGIYLPGSFLASRDNGFGPDQLMKERTYCLDRPIPISSNPPPVQEATAKYLSTLTIFPSFDPYLGNPLNLPKEGRFYGLAVDGVLLAIAECICRYRRGRGHCTSVCVTAAKTRTLGSIDCHALGKPIRVCSVNQYSFSTSGIAGSCQA
jgi:hypothetical protein